MGEDVLDGVENEGDVLDGVTGLRSLFCGCPVEPVDASGLGKGEVADGGVSEVETGLMISGAASSGLAMRRPPREPDRSRSPFMMGELHSHDKGDSRKSVVRFGRKGFLRSFVAGADRREGFVEMMDRRTRMRGVVGCCTVLLWLHIKEGTLLCVVSSFEIATDRR